MALCVISPLSWWQCGFFYFPCWFSLTSRCALSASCSYCSLAALTCLLGANATAPTTAALPGSGSTFWLFTLSSFHSLEEHWCVFWVPKMWPQTLLLSPGCRLQASFKKNPETLLINIFLEVWSSSCSHHLICNVEYIFVFTHWFVAFAHYF